MTDRIPLRQLQASDPDLPAGSLADWLASKTSAGSRPAVSNVPCGACNACCRSGYFIQIHPDEADTLAHIPSVHLFGVPGLPGHRLLGGAESACPMLVDDACSIYEHRPRSCRTFDCRLFAATGLDPGDDKPLIRAQAKRWYFDKKPEKNADKSANKSGESDREPDLHRDVREAATRIAADTSDLSDADRANPIRVGYAAVSTVNGDTNKR
mgnify:FL=1